MSSSSNTLYRQLLKETKHLRNKYIVAIFWSRYRSDVILMAEKNFDIYRKMSRTHIFQIDLQYTNGKDFDWLLKYLIRMSYSFQN